MAKNSWTCPFCNRAATISDDDVTDFQTIISPHTTDGEIGVSGWVRVCPADDCREYEVVFRTESIKRDVHFRPSFGGVIEQWALRPASRAKPFPDYVPLPLRIDYNEACAIENLSPKASATLSRRCLQGIIRDFYGVVDKNLYNEIAAIKGRVSPALWSAIDALREVGNIGAHPEASIDLIVEVEPGEAAALIDLIELLFRVTYAERDRDEQILAEATNLATNKKALRAEQKMALTGGKEKST